MCPFLPGAEAAIHQEFAQNCQVWDFLSGGQSKVQAGWKVSFPSPLSRAAEHEEEGAGCLLDKGVPGKGQRN